MQHTTAQMLQATLHTVIKQDVLPEVWPQMHVQYTLHVQRLVPTHFT